VIARLRPDTNPGKHRDSVDLPVFNGPAGFGVIEVGPGWETEFLTPRLIGSSGDMTFL